MNRLIQLIGNTVTRWNSAKLASGISAPMRSSGAWFRIRGMIGEGSSRPCSRRRANSSVATSRSRENKATTLIAKAQKKG